MRSRWHARGSKYMTPTSAFNSALASTASKFYARSQVGQTPA